MIDERKFVQFGAGNIGRSFIGQLFSRAGFEVVFIDVVDELIEALNDRGRYEVQVKGKGASTIEVENVRAVDGRDIEAVAEELTTCRACGTAVGPKALPAIQPTLARSLQMRHERDLPPLDVIICENLRDAAAIMRDGLAENLPDGFPLDETVGLVETSIGKMVPIMPEDVRRRDPLLVYAEAYNTLICDKKGFQNPIPDVAGLEPKENMAAWVDRKSFVHNFGHALCAYFSFLEAPELEYTWQAIEHPTVGAGTREGMWESANALIAEYSEEFDHQHMDELIEDLLARYANKALGDTIFRVGRDTPRKLSREDRIIGPLLLETKHDEPGEMTALCAAAGMRFRAEDRSGEPYPRDAELAAQFERHGPEYVLEQVCELDPAEPLDRSAYDAVLEANGALERRLGRGDSIFG